ncbi:hypothetical protein D3C75_731400 [compost metagenome]
MGLIHLAIQHPQRVAVHPRLAVLAQEMPFGLQEAKQRFTVCAAAFRIADGVDLHPHPFQTQLLIDSQSQRNDLGINGGIRSPEGFHAELVELAEASGLRLLIAEHGSGVIQLAHIRLAIQLVFHIGAHHTGGSFRPQGDGPVALVQEGVHFLLHDIRGFPYPPGKQLRMLKNRRPDFLVMESAADIPRGFLDKLPYLYSSRQKILRPFGSLNTQRPSTAFPVMILQK